MSRRGLIVVLLIVLTACGTTVTLGDELARRESEQHGPKVVVAHGRLPDGEPWIFYAYRRDRAQICFRHAWLERGGARESEGACSPPEGPRVVQSSVTYPGPNGNDELRYYVGLVADAHADRVRWVAGGETQLLSVLRNRAFPGLGFTIARLEMSRPPDRIELLDAGGAVLHSERFSD